MRISLRIHVLALWKIPLFLLIVTSLLLIVFGLYNLISLILIVSLIIVTLIVFIAFRERYIIFHRYKNVNNQIKKVLDLLSIKYKVENNIFLINKINIKVKLVKIGLVTKVSFIGIGTITDKEKYIKTTMLKYQYAL